MIDPLPEKGIDFIEVCPKFKITLTDHWASNNDKEINYDGTCDCLGIHSLNIQPLFFLYSLKFKRQKRVRFLVGVLYLSHIKNEWTNIKFGKNTSA